MSLKPATDGPDDAPKWNESNLGTVQFVKALQAPWPSRSKMANPEPVSAAIAFGPGRRRLVRLVEIVRNQAGEIETGRFVSLRLDEIMTVAFDPTARLQAEGVTYRFVPRKDGTFRVKRRN